MMPIQTLSRAERIAALRGSLLALAATALLGAAVLAPLAASAQHSGDFALTYTQEKAKFSGNYCQCFTMRGATADFAYSFWHGIGVSTSGQGLAVSNLNGNIDIHQITFMVGPRYTYNVGRIDPVVDTRRGGIFIDGKVGYTFATAGLYPVNGTLTDHASGLTYQVGGGINLNLYHRFELRLIEVDAVRTQLPNGANNQQDSLRMAAGVNVHLGR